MFFARVDPQSFQLAAKHNASISYRYSTFNENYFPYACIGASDYSIRYSYSQGMLKITL